MWKNKDIVVTSADKWLLYKFCLKYYKEVINAEGVQYEAKNYYVCNKSVKLGGALLYVKLLYS